MWFEIGLVVEIFVIFVYSGCDINCVCEGGRIINEFVFWKELLV